MSANRFQDFIESEEEIMPMQKTKTRAKEFNFFLEEAKRLGAQEARIINTNKVVVEDRVLLKCKSGCHMYGHKFVCPPYAPTPDEFRKILKEYQKVIMITFPFVKYPEGIGMLLID
jgi:predicted metal-binding protein